MHLINEISYTREHIFLTGVNEPRKFSSEFEEPCLSAKLFHLEQFAIYGSFYSNNKANVTSLNTTKMLTMQPAICG